MSLDRRRKSQPWLALPWAPNHNVGSVRTASSVKSHTNVGSTMMVKRCPNVIADELSIPRTQSLQAMNQSHISLQEPALNSLGMDQTKRIHRSNSRPKLELTPEQKAKQQELYKGLDERKSKLDTVLQDKIKELKALCLNESEITGELPHEYTLFMTPGERTPTVKKRMGTAFSIAELVSGKDTDLTKLEMEYELQKQILKAKQKLANDETLSKNVRKKHNHDYLEAKSKLKELEQNLKSCRTQAGLDAGSFTSEDNASLGSFGSSPALTKSPKKSVSSQQLESLECSPNTRRRMNSMSRLQNSQQKSTLRQPAFDIPSNPSSTSSLASISQLEGHSEFTPVKGLKYNRSTLGSSAQSGSSSGNHHHHHHQQQSSHIPIVHSSADLNSVGSSTANSSTSSLHAYSVSGGRPLRSGSMDDVRLAANGSGSSPHQHSNPQAMDRSSNGTNSRSKSYLTNNPYGSLERKALKQRRTANRAMNEAPPNPLPNMYNPYAQNQRVDNYSNYATMDSYNRYHPEGYRHSPPSRTEDQPPPIPAARVPKQHHPQQQQQQPQPAYRPRANHQTREYAHNVHQASRRMYDSTSQPFQMLDNPYNTHRRNMDHLGQSLADAHIAPIQIDTHPHMPSAPHRRPSGGDRQYHTDSSSDLNSPQENAFSFFNNLNSYVQHNSVVNNNNPYKQAGPASADLNRHRASYGQEETKPYEMKDFYQYSERLRKARGMNQHCRSQEPPPPLPAARSSGSRTPSSPGVSLEGSRSGSPYTNGPPPPAAFSNGSGSSRGSPNMMSQMSPHHYPNMSMQGYTSNTGTLRGQGRRSMPKDSSFNTGDVADNFSSEMLAWYQDSQEPEHTSSTLV